MSIDASLIKNLLQLQLLRQMNLITSGEDSGSTPDGMGSFDEILQSLSEEKSTLAGDPATLAGSEVMLRLLSGTNAPVSAAAGKPTAQLGKAGIALDPAVGKPSSYDALIQQESSHYGIDPNLVKAVIHQESSFNPYAVSSAGAKGLMQLMDGTAKGYGVTDPFDPQQNIRAGTQFLSGLMLKYNGNEGAALAAYNAGPGRLDRLNIRNDADLARKLDLLPKQTQQYVRRVLDLKGTYADSAMKS